MIEDSYVQSRISDELTQLGLGFTLEKSVGRNVNLSDFFCGQSLMNLMLAPIGFRVSEFSFIVVYEGLLGAAAAITGSMTGLPSVSATSARDAGCNEKASNNGGPTI